LPSLPPTAPHSTSSITIRRWYNRPMRSLSNSELGSTSPQGRIHSYQGDNSILFYKGGGDWAYWRIKLQNLANSGSYPIKVKLSPVKYSSDWVPHSLKQV
jgi:hypothetical protein